MELSVKRLDNQGLCCGLTATVAAGLLAVTPWLSGLEAPLLRPRTGMARMVPTPADGRLVHLVHDGPADGLVGQSVWAELLQTLGEAGANSIGLDVDWAASLKDGIDAENIEETGPSAWLDGRLPLAALATVTLRQRDVSVHVAYGVARMQPTAVLVWQGAAAVRQSRSDAAEALEAEVFHRLTQPVGGGEAGIEPRFVAEIVDSPPVAMMLGSAKPAAAVRPRECRVPFTSQPVRPMAAQPLVLGVQGRVLPHLGLALAADLLEIDPLRLTAANRRVVVGQRIAPVQPIPLTSLREGTGWDVEALRRIVDGKAVLLTQSERGSDVAAVFTGVMAGSLHRLAPWWLTPAATVAAGLLITIVLALRWRRRGWLLVLLAATMVIGWGAGSLALGWYAPLGPLLAVAILGPALWGATKAAGGAIGWCGQRVRAAGAAKGGDVSRALEAVVLTAWPHGLELMGQRLHASAAERGAPEAIDLLTDLSGAMRPAVAAAEPLDAAWRDGSVRCVFDADGDAAKAAQRAAGLAVRMQDLARAFRRRVERRLGEPAGAKPGAGVSWHVGLAGGSTQVGPALAAESGATAAVGGPIEAAWRLASGAWRLGLAVLADEWTRGQAGAMYLTRPIGLVRLHVGREPAMVWELLGESNRISAVQRQQAQIAGEMVQMFARREFDAAMQRVEALAALDGRDPLPGLYRRLIHQRSGQKAEDFDATLPI